MESGSQSSCDYGLDDFHRQLYHGKNAPPTRWWLKELLFICHYGRGCGYVDDNE